MSGLTDAERVRLADATTLAVGAFLGRQPRALEVVADVAEAIVAARESAAVEAFRAKAVEQIESWQQMHERQRGQESDVLSLIRMARVSSYKRAARIVRDLDTT